MPIDDLAFQYTTPADGSASGLAAELPLCNSTRAAGVAGAGGLRPEKTNLLMAPVSALTGSMF